MLLAMQLALTVAIAPLSPKLSVRPTTIDGKTQCLWPNAARRTCRGLARYKSNGNFGMTSTVTTLLTDKPVIVMKMTKPVRVVNDAICGTLYAADIAAAAVTRDGVAMSRDQAQPILSQVIQGMGPAIGRELCTRVGASATTLISKVWINGVYQPAADQPMMWVGPNEGYVVAP